MLLRPRPLSPHLQIYRFQLTSVLSILHRFTGGALFAGMFVWSGFLALLCLGFDPFILTRSFFFHIIGMVGLGGWLFALYYHLLNGIRHLFWDIGKGFELTTVYATGWLVVLGSILFTALTMAWYFL